MGDDEIARLFNPEVFVGYGPPWLLWHEGAGSSPTAADVVTFNFGGKGGTGKALTVFTDEDLAERFRAAIGPKAAGFGIARLSSLDRFEVLLDDIIRTGLTHVRLDPGSDPNAGGYIPAAAFLAAIRSRPRG